MASLETSFSNPKRPVHRSKVVTKVVGVSQKHCLREVERTLALVDSKVQFGAQGVKVTVVGHLEVVDTSHDGWEEVVRGEGSLSGLADDGKHGRERFETCVNKVSKAFVGRKGGNV